MIIAEAIRLLGIAEEEDRAKGLAEYADAYKLGIEALKRVKLLRDPTGEITPIYLPGETEE